MRLVSGENLATCKQMALQCGILEPMQLDADKQLEQNGRYAINASDLRDIVGVQRFGLGLGEEELLPGNQDAFNQLMETLKVVARAEPSDRILILNGLRAKGEKVAFVGKGALDLPTLDSAYVSYSVESSAQVIKERSNMGLMDASLSTFINSVIWGRNLYNNIQRFLQFQITCNFSLLVTILVGYIYLTESPLNAVQLLWINIIMEVLATLALSTVPPKPSMMKEAPSKQGEKLLSQVVWRSIYSIGLWNVIVMSVLIFFGKQMHGLNYGSAVQTTDTYHESSDLTFDAEAKKTHMTLLFNTFIFLQVFNMINCRVVGAKDLNVFEHIFDNYTFATVFVVICLF